MSRTYEDRIGHRLPEGRIRLTPHQAWLWTHCVEGIPDAQAPHPSMAWYIAEHGCGIGIDELFELFDAEASDGPVLGEAELEFAAPLRTGADYRVESVIDQVERKHGRSGVFDRVVVRMDVFDADTEERTCTLWNTTIFPRREDA